ncbi:MAG: arginine--tRNA ligase [Chloroflexi bacterium]|nr:arginine--tRNA ligase [Chloroflexota bacterium]
MEPTRSALRRLLGAAVEGSGIRPPESAAVAAPTVNIEVTRPQHAEHGDFATNLALKLARPLKRRPLEIADTLAEALRALPEAHEMLTDVDVAPPGFLNVRLSAVYLAQAVDAVRAAGPTFGRLRAEQPGRLNVEFVSANPTGPLHIGNARGAFVGDLVCRILEGAGHEVTREYYFNDSGTQVRMLGESVRALRDGDPPPKEGYRGEYVRQLADELPPELGERASHPGEDPALVLGEWASQRIRGGIEASLARLGVRFDVWRTETMIERDGWIEQALERLRSSGHLYEAEGATWFRSTAYGDDKDRVIRRSNGEYTYFGKDIGYLVEKFSRGFDRLIYLWGADHHGTVARLRNAAEAMGFDKAAVEVPLIAWVRFVREGREISMSKRAGEFITLDELLSEVGVDAARWFFAARSHNTGIDFDIELAKRQSNENPVYYVQYAHARIASILRKATEEGLQPATSLRGALADDTVGQGLAKQLLRLPEVIEDAADARETQGVTAYATELATTFHAYYRDRRVVDQADPETSARRLALVEATRITLANTLGLVGISAPEAM